MKLLKRIGLTLGSGVAGYVITILTWILCLWLSRIPFVGGPFAESLWAANFLLDGITARLGLTVPGFLGIMAALSTAAHTWQELAPPKDWQPNYPPAPPAEPLTGAVLAERVNESLRKKAETQAQAQRPIPLSDEDDLPDFLRRR